MAAGLKFQTAAAANGNGSAFKVSGRGVLLVDVSGTFSATVNFEGTVNADAGTPIWRAITAVNYADGSKGTTATAAGQYIIPAAGLDSVRCRVSAYISGSVTAEGRYSDANTSITIADVQLETADIEIGAVELKNATSDDRATIASDGRLATDANLQVGDANAPGGAGAVTAATPRVTLGSDDPAVASLSVLDDWDETDRAKVNPIVGQAGVAGGSGVVGTTTQRVVLATDVALPSGANAIGKLAANSGVDIGDVDVTTVVPGTGATNLGKAADAVAGATDTGVAPLGVRDDALGALVPIEGDYAPLRLDANGALWTHDDALDAALAGTELQVDVVGALPAGANNIGDVDVLTEPATAADGAVGLPATTKVVSGYDGANVQALKTDAAGELQVDVLTVPAPLSTSGGGVEATALRVTLANDSTGLVSVDDNAGSLTVDVGTALPAGANNIGDVDVLTVPAPLSSAGGGTEAAALRVTIANDSTGLVSVDDNAASLTVDNATLSVVGGGLEATAMRVTLASDSTGLVSVDDNAGSLTVDNAALAVTGGGVEATALRVTLASDSTGLVSVDDNGAALSVDDNAGSLTVDNAALSVTGGGVEAAALRVTLASDSTGLVSVDDNAGSLTVDNTTLAVVGGGTEATAMRVTLANDSTGVVSVDDNAASLTVDNAALSVTGGGVEAGTLRVTLANDSTGVVSVDDNAASLTVDNAALSVTGGGVEASALRVTIANDSTGVVSVDDNAGSLTVDVGSALPAGSNNIGDVDVLSVPTSIVAPANQASTDAFADVAGATVDTSTTGAKFVAFLLKEVGGANGITYRVQASIDGTTYTNVVGPIDATGAEDADGEVAVGANGSQEWFITPEYDSGAKAAYRHYKVQVKATVAASQGTAQVRIFAK